MNPKRLALALERLGPSDWKDFEDLASIFLASQFPGLRVLATTSGDKGRDSAMWQPEDDPTVVVQYSVTTKWPTKVLETAERIRETVPTATVLIFVSPHEIGARGDVAVAKLRKEFALHLDIRDRNYFLTRVNAGGDTEAAAESLAKRIVDPYLASTEAIDNKALVLPAHEAKAAVVYIALQLEDDSAEKGLTKVCFEGLVRAVLRGTSPESLMSRSEIHRRVADIVPAEDAARVEFYVDSALQRMERRYIRHHTASDDFCLSYDERLRITGRLADFEILDLAFRIQLCESLGEEATALGISLPTDVEPLKERVRRVLECLLIERGEAFVEALKTGELHLYSSDEINQAVENDLLAHPDRSPLRGVLVRLVTSAIEAVLVAPAPDVLEYLNLLASSYTLFALVKAAPNVQAALVHLFADGEIWLDTSFVLPLISETLWDAEDRRFTTILSAAQQAGMRFYITEGVLEELEAHTYRCIKFTSNSETEWRGNVPFLYVQFILSGRARNEFLTWIEEFRGRSRPQDDLREYIRDEFRIEVRNLDAECAAADNELRTAVSEVWNEIQDRRRERSELDSITAQKLARHDAESYLGVIQRRGHVESSPFGYRVWWLTLDRSAFTVRARIADRLASPPPVAPVLSPDFLSHYLSIGRMRQRLDRGTEHTLPLMIEVSSLDLVPPEVLRVADQIRTELRGQPQRVIRRRIRDAMDKERIRLGPIASEYELGS